jgi:hypothetical protein
MEFLPSRFLENLTSIIEGEWCGAKRSVNLHRLYPFTYLTEEKEEMGKIR